MMEEVVRELTLLRQRVEDGFARLHEGLADVRRSLDQMAARMDRQDHRMDRQDARGDRQDARMDRIESQLRWVVGLQVATILGLLGIGAGLVGVMLKLAG